MDRRLFLLSMIPVALAAETARASRRGVLVSGEGRPPALRLPSGGSIQLTGDAPTLGVLNDARLAGADFEVLGAAVSPELFRVDPIHTKAMFVHRDGKRLMISYWCAVCSIRTYTPGTCMCCQEETQLDLQESFGS